MSDNESFCPKCGHKYIIIRERPDTVHHAEKICGFCGRWISWVKTPHNEGQRTKTSKYEPKQLADLKGYKNTFCFFCLRTKEQLPEHETLTLDHIEEISKGGLDDISNLQILCSACHKLKNWARLYMNWHWVRK